MMAAKIKSMKPIVDKLIFPLILTAIIGLTGLFFRVQALEFKILTIEDYMISNSKDLKFIKCYITKDELTCMQAKAYP